MDSFETLVSLCSKKNNMNDTIDLLAEQISEMTHQIFAKFDSTIGTITSVTCNKLEGYHRYINGVVWSDWSVFLSEKKKTPMVAFRGRVDIDVDKLLDDIQLGKMPEDHTIPKNASLLVSVALPYELAISNNQNDIIAYINKGYCKIYKSTSDQNDSGIGDTDEDDGNAEIDELSNKLTTSNTTLLTHNKDTDVIDPIKNFFVIGGNKTLH